MPDVNNLNFPEYMFALSFCTPLNTILESKNSIKLNK